MSPRRWKPIARPTALPRQQPLGLDRPSQPDEKLRLAFRAARLDRAGLNLDRVMAHEKALQLLRFTAAAQRRGHLMAARSYARLILSLKRELS